MNIHLLAPPKTLIPKVRRLKFVIHAAFIIAGAGLILGAPKAMAGPIQYEWSFQGNGSLGGQPFTTRPFTLTMTADTSTVTEIPPPTRANDNQGTVALEIAGLGSASVTSPIQIYTNFTNFGLSNPFDTVIFAFNGPIQNWDLRSAIGPFALDPGIMNGWSVDTDRGALAMGTTSNWHFVATTTPEPSSCALLGFGALGLLARRRR